MSHDDTAPQLGRFELGLIPRKCRQMIGQAGFLPQDQSDLEQELIARLCVSLRSYNPWISHRKVFVTTVVERHVANILRDKQAAKRDHRRVTSMNVHVQVDRGEPGELGDTISDRELNSRRDWHPRSHLERAQLRSDVAAVMAQLPDHLRDLASRLMQASKTRVAQELGVPRTTLND